MAAHEGAVLPSRAGSRKLAEEWTYRYLAAAYAWGTAEFALGGEPADLGGRTDESTRDRGLQQAGTAVPRLEPPH